MLLLAFQVRKNGKRRKRVTVVCSFPVSKMFTQKQTEVKSLMMEAVTVSVEVHCILTCLAVQEDLIACAYCESYKSFQDIIISERNGTQISHSLVFRTVAEVTQLCKLTVVFTPAQMAESEGHCHLTETKQQSEKEEF
jgi:hypothetical protein